MSNQFGHNRDRQRVAAARTVARQLGTNNHNAELLRQRQIQAQANFGGQNLAANGHAGAYGSPAPAAACANGGSRPFTIDGAGCSATPSAGHPARRSHWSHFPASAHCW